MYRNITEQLFAFIKKSPTAYHTVAVICGMLKEEGYIPLSESESWTLAPGGKYYVTRGGSSLLAFCVPREPLASGFQIVAVHGDSPSFKIKERGELEVREHYTQLNTEGYGGMLCATWLDRPLSVAGRVLYEDNGVLKNTLVDVERDLVLIPSVAIHMNREANDGMKYNKQVDMLPLFGSGSAKDCDLHGVVAKTLGIEKTRICGCDLFVYNRMEPSVWGAHHEFISAPRLDDLQCAFAGLQGFVNAVPKRAVNVYACFDNEEVGSGTRQGAASTFLYDTLHRICFSFGRSEEAYYRAIADSFMLSADNAHAVHPNHPEKTDAKNCVYMNEGIVIKSNAARRYTSDGVGTAVFREICRRAGVPVQYFANRSDERGGSTLGNLAQRSVPVCAVDIGLAQLAMHSAYETAGIKDTWYMIQALKAYYSTQISGLEEGSIRID